MIRDPAVPRVTGGLFLREFARLGRLIATNPWAARRRVPRLLGVLRARFLLRNCERGSLIVALGHVKVRAKGFISVGDRVQLAGGMFPTELDCRKGATLTIDAVSFLSYGVSICATQRVHIGKRCQIGSMVRIRDQNEMGAAPVTICDDVWLAYGVIVEPGVTVGAGSVVSAGSVVRDDVPPYSLAVGNPATSVPLAGAAVRASGAA
jgi:UDP-3-O-[3-hydroxymyristoyl] glucosamine N-acyltransferase